MNEKQCPDTTEQNVHVISNHSWSGKRCKPRQNRNACKHKQGGNRARIRLADGDVRAAVKHRYTLINIIAEQVMIKKPWRMGSTKPLVRFEVLSTHKGWSLSKAWGLRTYSVQSQGLLQRKVKTTQTSEPRIRRREQLCSRRFWYHVESKCCFFFIIMQRCDQFQDSSLFYKKDNQTIGMTEANRCLVNKHTWRV